MHVHVHVLMCVFSVCVCAYAPMGPTTLHTLIYTQHLVMTQNIFMFGSLTLKQLNGTAMGTPPAPHMQPYIMIYMKRNSSQDIANILFSLDDSLTTSLASGTQIQMRNMM